jgi:hypothetical protein
MSKKSQSSEQISSDEEGDSTGMSKSKEKGCNYSTFTRCKPHTFDGSLGTAAAQQWLREIEASIDIRECSKDQIVKYATHSLAGEALCW